MSLGRFNTFEFKYNGSNLVLILIQIQKKIIFSKDIFTALEQKQI